jgi:hypothetical protein
VFTACPRDLTGRQQAKAEQQAPGERRRQSDRLQSLGRLAGGMSARLQQPARVILNYAALVAQRSAATPAFTAEQIRAAVEQGARRNPRVLAGLSAVQGTGRLGNRASPAAWAIDGAASGHRAIDQVLRGQAPATGARG